MSLTAQQFDSVVRKLQMKERNGKHRFVFLEHNGRQVIWTARSHQGKGELGPVEHAIRHQLRVSSTQMKDLVNCPMTRELYIEHLTAIGVISAK